MRYHKLAYAALNVSNIDRSMEFYTKVLGLQLSQTGPNGEVYLRCSQDHHNVVLYEAAEVGLRRIGWMMESEKDVALLRQTLSQEGIETHRVSAEECRALHQGETYRYQDPSSGVTMEFFASMHEYPEGFTPTVAKIQRLGHVVLKAPAAADAVTFMTEKLNFRISDHVDHVVTFLRCFPNPFHHSLGIAHGDGLHHVNFMVSEIDDIGKALARFQANDVPIVWGPGRHPPSESVFLYFLDPDGMTLEYSFGMEEFLEDNPRRPRSLFPDAKSADTWGSRMDPRYTAKGAVIRGADLPLMIE